MKQFTDRRIVLLGWSGFVFVPALLNVAVDVMEDPGQITAEYVTLRLAVYVLFWFAGVALIRRFMRHQGWTPVKPPLGDPWMPASQER
ncbi:hypothetical protein [Nonomuraea salmonea]|uniref:Uncharacterized protein n=1 Tax=Nonomuraea salmonea TaxID=46181 RepID=A0ABV5NVM4_9ACTN